jgi:4-hydroxy-2-oxoheptanedioate aldolase
MRDWFEQELSSLVLSTAQDVLIWRQEMASRIGTIDTPAIGLWSCTDSIALISEGARVGFEFVAIDLQHGLLSGDNLPAAVAAARSGGGIVLVRPAWNRPELIMRALDAGADGVIVPMVSSAAEVAAAVRSASYPPKGDRSWGPLTSAAARTPQDGNAHRIVLVMIETADGLHNLDEIVAVPGLDGVYIGPNDLALSLGMGRQTYAESNDLHAAIDHIASVARARGLVVGYHANSVKDVGYWRTRGVTMLAATTDTSIAQSALWSAARDVGLRQDSDPTTAN